MGIGLPGASTTCSYFKVGHANLFLLLIAAADLKALVTYPFESHEINGRVQVPPFLNFDTSFIPAMFLTMIAPGSRLSTTSASRESMIKLLLKYRVNLNDSGGALG